MSAVRKTALWGAHGGAEDGVHLLDGNPSSTMACIACIMPKTPTRLPTKFGVSLP